MPPKTLSKSQIQRISCFELAQACAEWGVPWEDGEDELVARADLLKKIRGSKGAPPQAPNETLIKGGTDVCVWVCAGVRARARARACACACVHARVRAPRVCACTRVCVCAWVRGCVGAWVRVCVCAWVRGWVRGCVGA